MESGEGTFFLGAVGAALSLEEEDTADSEEFSQSNKESPAFE
jgi:hypothetical protein